MSLNIILEVCLTDECAITAARVLESMDKTVNPCEDFYTYACGGWKKSHVIPEDRSSLNVFGVLRDEVQVINKSKRNQTKQHTDNNFINKSNKILTIISLATDR